MSEIIVTQGDTHDAPATGKVKIYAKTDGKVYRKIPDGTETELGGGAGGGHVIADEYNSLPNRSTLNFFGNGVAVSDNSVNDLTNVSIPGSHIIQDEGSSRVTRAYLNFIGPSVTATDNSGSNRTDVTIASREVLTADRTYYVATTGSDSNNGLAVGTPFLTIQKAIDVAATLDCSIYNIIIQVGDGTHVTNSITCKNIIGSGTVTIQGNSSTPSSVIIDGGFAKTIPGTVYEIWYFKLIKSSGTATTAINANGGAAINIKDLEFGAGFTYQIFISTVARVFSRTAYVISGGASYHLYISRGGDFLTVTGCTIATGLAFAYFAYGTTNSGIAYSGTINLSGTMPAGTRYIAVFNAVINTIGGGPNYFPGNIAGSTTTGGQYV